MTTQFRCLDTGKPLTVARRNFRRIERIDEYPDISWLRDAADRERLDAFREGIWHLIGIQAVRERPDPARLPPRDPDRDEPRPLGHRERLGRDLARRGLRRGMRKPHRDAQCHRRHRNRVTPPRTAPASAGAVFACLERRVRRSSLIALLCQPGVGAWRGTAGPPGLTGWIEAACGLDGLFRLREIDLAFPLLDDAVPAETELA